MANLEQTTVGADVLVQALKIAKIEQVFAITGAGNLAIIDALVRDGEISIVYSHHEQAAVMEAQGYSRASGKIGVALVTTGGGTSNVVTGVLSAYLDSIPVLIISGNESSFHCENPYALRAYGVQGFDSCAVLSPIVKSSKRITNVNETADYIAEAIRISLTDRMGPTHVDFPMDLQRKTALFEVMLNNHENRNIYSDNYPFDVETFLSDLNQSKKPIFYFGNGVRKPETLKLAKELVKASNIPYVVSWSAIDLFPESDELNIGRVGIYGDRHANILLQKADLLVSIGTRLAIPQIGYDRSDFARKAKKWVIEIDLTECEKFEGLHWNVAQIDSEEFLTEVTRHKQTSNKGQEWVSECKEIKKLFPREAQLGPEVSDPTEQIHSGKVIAYLNKNLDGNAVICTDVGAALLTGHYMYEQSGDRRFFTSQGLGEMGFGLPGAIGAYFENRQNQIICLNTDGAIMLNLQELQVVREHRIPLKLFIFNNFGYSMIRISQDNLFDGRLAGSTSESGISFPDFKSVAHTFNFSHTVIRNEADLPRIREALNSNDAELIEIVMDPLQRYYPRLATNKLDDGTFVSPPLEDLDPKIEIETLEKLLGYEAHLSSYKARGLK